MYLIWILGSELIRSNNQSSATLWVLETCLIVGLLPLKIILITASLSSNTYHKASWCDIWTFEGTRSTLLKTLNIPRDCWPCAWLASRQTTGCPVLSWFWVVFPKTQTIRSHNSRAGNPSNPQSIVQRDDFRFCRTVRNGSLFLTHPTYWNKCMTSKNAKCSSRSGCWLLKISRKIGVLRQSQPALFCSITHIAILFAFTCVMNVRYQSIQAFDTGFGPFCNWSCKFVHWP